MKQPEAQEDAGGASVAEPDFAAYVGLDWADEKHVCCLAVAGTAEREREELRNTPEDLQVWAAGLYHRFGGRKVAVCLEQSRGGVVFQLAKFPHLELYPAHPTTLAKYRQAFCPSGSKNDPGDSGLLLELVMRHREHLRRLQPEDEQTRLLQMLVEHRRKLVDDRTALSNRLTAWLKTYYPQTLNWIDDVDSKLGCAWLERWPTLQEVQRCHAATLRQFFQQHHSRSPERIQQRIQAIQQATPAVTDQALLRAGAMITRTLVASLKVLGESIAQLDTEIAELAAQHPEARLFSGLPGAGPVLGPRLIVAFGTQRQRYHTAQDLQSYSGIAPVTMQSGNTRCVHFRYACPKFLRQTFHEFAAHSIHRSVWARAYYQMYISRHPHDKHKHHAAVRALAYKWMRVLFRCWQDRTPYDEAVYLRALEKHHSPLAQASQPGSTDSLAAVTVTGLEWRTVSGFQKLCRKNA